MSPNPNICLDCERLTFDDSPMLVVSTVQEVAQPAPRRSTAFAEALVPEAHKA